MNKAIVYILAEFPSRTETFILKEMLFINRSFPLYIIALRKGKTTVNKSGYKELEKNLIYITPFVLSKSIGYYFLSLFENKQVLQKWKNIFDDVPKVNIINSLHQIKWLLTGLCISKRIKQKPIVHIHSHFANYPTDIAMLVSKISGIPFSFSAHAHDIYVNPQKLTQKISESEFVTTCTSCNKKWMDKLVPASERNKIHLLYHGVDLEYWPYNVSQNRKNRKQILFIGRLIEKKGIIYLLEAMVQLKKEKHAIRLVIAGKGKDEQKLKKFCHLHGLSKDVTFPGWQNPQQIKDLFACSGMLVLPSVIASNGDRDGIPNVILEAMASGLPVVSTPVSGITEVIQDKYNGLLVPERDAIQLADSIGRLANDEILRNAIVHNGLHTVSQKFDDRKCNILLKSLFESILMK
jgi:glycosyltransferase involved in cell wall biosynthesis